MEVIITLLADQEREEGHAESFQKTGEGLFLGKGFHESTSVLGFELIFYDLHAPNISNMTVLVIGVIGSRSGPVPRPATVRITRTRSKKDYLKFEVLDSSFTVLTMKAMAPNSEQTPGYEEPNVLAAATPFTASEVEALYVLFKKLSSSIIADGLIHKEEFQLALFRNRNQRNLFADRLFDLFDMKGNGVIEFGEFVRSLGIFHPNAPIEDKITFAYRLYDLRHTGYIEREELKEMVLALLHESDLVLSEDVVETIVDKAFSEADTKDDGRIDQEEWKDYVLKNPSLIRNMTLPYLKDITLAFPSFILSSESHDSEV
ncbi:hypothetical protein NL676_000360 [Syzygium grande]|nr:hypothetical protein NL676_000360 [Syzygium grande]